MPQTFAHFFLEHSDPAPAVVLEPVAFAPTSTRAFDRGILLLTPGMKKEGPTRRRPLPLCTECLLDQCECD